MGATLVPVCIQRVLKTLVVSVIDYNDLVQCIVYMLFTGQDSPALVGPYWEKLLNNIFIYFLIPFLEGRRNYSEKLEKSCFCHRSFFLFLSMFLFLFLSCFETSLFQFATSLCA